MKNMMHFAYLFVLFYAVTVADTDATTSCQIAEVAACMTALTSMDMTDFTQMCRAAVQAKECAEEKVQGCPEEQKESIMAAIAHFHEICGESVSTTPAYDKCEIFEVYKCFHQLTPMLDHSVTCSLIQGAKECAMTKLQGCSEEEKHVAMSTLVQLETMCGESVSTTPASGTCQLDEAHQCLLQLGSMHRVGDLSVLCSLIKGAKECAFTKIQGCSEEEKYPVMSSFVQIETICGESVTTTPEYGTCQLNEVHECLDQLGSMHSGMDMSVLCGIIQESNECAMRKVQGCTEEVQHSAMSPFVQYESMCGEPVSTTPASGTCQLDEAHHCLLQLGSMRRVGDLSVLCSLIQGAKECAFTKIQGCSEEEKYPVMSPLVQMDTMCGESVPTTPEYGTCQLNEVRECLDQLGSMHSGMDMSVLCSIIQEANECAMRKVQGCTEEVQHSAMSPFVQYESMCGEPVSTTPASCTCQLNDAHECFLQLGSMHHVSDISVLCSVIQEAKECAMKNLRSCPEEAKHSAMSTYVQFESMCGEEVSTTPEYWKCQLNEVDECLEQLGSMYSGMDMSVLCSLMRGAKECIVTKLQGCSEEVKHELMSGFDQLDSVCGESVPTTPEYGRCQLTEVDECFLQLGSVQSGKDMSVLCSDIQGVKGCATTKLQGCSVEVKQSAMSTLVQYESMCVEPDTT